MISVCGSDRVTYVNACVAECHEEYKYTEGACVLVSYYTDRQTYRQTDRQTDKM